MPEKVYRFAVKGNTAFPIDMLRYDCCYPDSSDDAAAIGGSHSPRGSVRERTIRLRSTVKPPTYGRWESFGWRVVAG